MSKKRDLSDLMSRRDSRKKKKSSASKSEKNFSILEDRKNLLSEFQKNQELAKKNASINQEKAPTSGDSVSDSNTPLKSKKDSRNNSEASNVSVANAEQTRSNSVASKNDTRSKSVANAEQTRSDKTNSNQNSSDKTPLSVANAEQTRSNSVASKNDTRSKSVANAEQARSRSTQSNKNKSYKANVSVANAEQMRSNSVAQPVAQPVANAEQESSESLTDQLYQLANNEYNLLKQITKICLNEGSRRTPKLKYQNLKDVVKSTAETTRNALNRLKSKQLIIKKMSKPGRAGFVVFEVPQNVYYTVLRIENNFSQELIPEQTRSNSVAQTVAQTVATSPTTTTYNNTTYSSSKENEEGSLPREWREIEIPPFLKSKGFHDGHTKQIYQSKIKYKSDREDITADSVQESFDHFAYDIENGYCNPTGSIVSYFMKVLRSQGINWVSEAVVEAERLQLEKLKKASKAKEELEIEKEKNNLIKKYQKIASSLTDSRKKEILQPKRMVAEFGSVTYERLLIAKIEEIIKNEGLEFFEHDLNSKESDFSEELKNLNL